MNRVGMLGLVGVMACTFATAGGPKPSKKPEGKPLVFRQISAGQILMRVKMPKLNGPGFLCLITRSDAKVQFKGHFESGDQPKPTIEGPADDMYECVISPYQSGSEIVLVSDVNITMPIGIVGQVQVLEGHQ